MNSQQMMEEIDRLARLCAEKDSENVRLNEGWHNANFEALQAKQQLSEAQSQIAEKDAAYEQLKETTFKSLDYANEEMRNLETQIAMQAEALKSFIFEMADEHGGEHHEADCPYCECIILANSALSATSETVAAWRAKETEPLRREVAMMSEALKVSKPIIDDYETHLDFDIGGIIGKTGASDKVSTAISATSETVAAWRAKETEPLRREVAMMHNLKYELRGIAADIDEGNGFNVVCRRTLGKVIESLSNAQAIALAYDLEVKAKALEDFALRLERCESRFPATIYECAESARIMAAELRATNKGEVQ